MRLRVLAPAFVVFAAAVAFAAEGGPTKTTGNQVTSPSGLRYWELKVGTGPAAERGDIAKVRYTGWLTDGTKFDSSDDHGGTPLRVWIGKGQVIAGWDEGLVGMKVGGKRQLHIPAKLGYGSKGTAGIPPNADLVFDVELVSVAK